MFKQILFVIYLFIIIIFSDSSIIAQESNVKMIEKIKSLDSVQSEVEELKSQSLILKKRLSNQNAFGEYAGVETINDQLNLLDVEIRYLIALYVIKTNSIENCFTIDLNKLIDSESSWIDYNLDFHIQNIDLVITLDVRESIFDLGNSTKKLIKDIRKIIREH